MNKADLVNAVADAVRMTKKDAKTVVDEILLSIENGLINDGKVSLVGFGTFRTVERAARKGRNPKTGEEINIPAKTVPKFKPSNILKEIVNLED